MLNSYPILTLLLDYDFNCQDCTHQPYNLLKAVHYQFTQMSNILYIIIQLAL